MDRGHVGELLEAGWPKELVRVPDAPQVDAIMVDNVSKRFDQLVMRGVSLTIVKGDVVGIVGPVGAGKTTLLQVLVGFLEPDGGSVRVLSSKQHLLVSEVRSSFGFAAQNPSFYEQLTVEENVVHFGMLAGVPSEQMPRRCHDVLSRLGLLSVRHRLAFALSRGMQKKLDLGLALLVDPEVLILDEPTADLDRASKEQIWAIVKQLNKIGKTIIVASHDLTDLQSVCTRLFVLSEGSLLPLRTKKELVVQLETRRRAYPVLQGARVENGRLIFSAASPKDILGVVAQVARSDEIVSIDVQEKVVPV